MHFEVLNFGCFNNETIYLIKMINDDGTMAELINYGATLRSLYVKKKNEEIINVVLGYKTLEEYVKNDGTLGATVGRYANRIGNASFSLNGKTFNLFKNDGQNTLHGGGTGFDKHVWDYSITQNSVIFSRTSPDKEEGFPGEMKIYVEYTLYDNCLKISYKASTTKPTVINLTNHSYFNLNGYGNILRHKLKINSKTFTELDDSTLPTGKILACKNTALDFTKFKEIGCDINETKVARFGGYDHNFIIDSKDKGNEPFAAVKNEDNSLKMECFTDQPGVQLYTANNLSTRECLNGVFGKYGGVCLETQHFPNSPNILEFPSTKLEPDKIFSSFTIYKFS